MIPGVCPIKFDGEGSVRCRFCKEKGIWCLDVLGLSCVLDTQVETEVGRHSGREVWAGDTNWI